MKSNDILYSAGRNDECYTPAHAVLPILKYIPADARVWCPFDTTESKFPALIGMKNRVIFSHIDYGQDFYTYDPGHWDVMVSNPPFTDKRKIFERALSFGRPFALLMTLTWLNDAAPKQVFADKDLQLLMFDKRVRYCCNGTTGKSPTFSSAYYCWNFLPKQIIMEKLPALT
jgi:hypothetical protein